MLSFWNLFERLGRERGAPAVVELAAFAAVWPYVSGGLPTLDAVSAPFVFAGSLVVTLILVVATRVAMAGAASPTFQARSGAGDAATVITVAADKSAEPLTSSGLPGREVLMALLNEREFTGDRGTLGVLRVANHAPMVAFDPAGGRRVMDTLAHRLKMAIGRRFLAQPTDDSFALWFEGSILAASDELKALGYILSQEVTEANLTVAPDIHASVTAFPADGHTPKTLLGHALGSAMSFKKFALPATSIDHAITGERQANRFAMEQALRRAVRAGELSLRYQPLVDTALGRVAGAEVLLRWRHPTFGDVPPAVFVPLLEETGLIHEIGLWTLNSACRQLSLWRNAGHPDIRLAINLSAVQLQDPALKSAITRIIGSHGLAPSDVELELTETAAMEDRERTLDLFQALRNLGFGIAIDDFGNGHSNFGYLRSLPFTKLKIDREFVSHIDTQPGSQAICKSLIELGAGLGIAILAEGVERFEEVATLRRLGCRQFQGYYFARPLTDVDFTSQLGDVGWLSTIASDVLRERTELKKRIVS